MSKFDRKSLIKTAKSRDDLQTWVDEMISNSSYTKATLCHEVHRFPQFIYDTFRHGSNQRVAKMIKLIAPYLSITDGDLKTARRILLGDTSHEHLIHSIHDGKSLLRNLTFMIDMSPYTETGIAKENHVAQSSFRYYFVRRDLKMIDKELRILSPYLNLTDADRTYILLSVGDWRYISFSKHSQSSNKHVLQSERWDVWHHGSKDDVINRIHDRKSLLTALNTFIYRSPYTKRYLENKLGHHDKYFKAVVKNCTSQRIKQLLRRLAPYLDLSVKDCDEMVANDTAVSPYMTNSYRHVTAYRYLCSLRVIEYLKILTAVHNNNISDIARSHRLNTNFIQLAVIQRPDFIAILCELIPKLSAKAVTEVFNGHNRQIKSQLDILRGRVHSQGGYLRFVRAVTWSQDTTLGRISKQLGHAKSYLRNSFMYKNYQNVKSNGIIVAHVLDFDPDYLVKPLKHAHIPTSNPKHSTHFSIPVDMSLRRLRKTLWGTIRAICYQNQVLVTHLSKRLYGKSYRLRMLVLNHKLEDGRQAFDKVTRALDTDEDTVKDMHYRIYDYLHRRAIAKGNIKGKLNNK